MEAENVVVLSYIKGHLGPPDVERDKERFFPRPLHWEHSRTDTLILGFCPPEWWDNKFLLF